MRKSFLFGILFFLGSVASVMADGSHETLTSGPWKGRIIDIETKEPLEGVVVLAVWDRAYRTLAGDNTYFYEAKEVLTDKEGRFEIPSYRPINLLPIISYIKGPEFTVFKPGYLSLSGRYLDENVIDNPAEFKRNEKIYKLAPGVIELPKLKTRDERLGIISLPTSIPDDKMPKLIELMNKEAVDLGLKPTHLKGGSK